ncbi:MAG: type II toxin-antitoxin system death-on-curing family toxin [Nitrosotalea sp.]
MVKLSSDEIISIHDKITDRFKITKGVINKSILDAIVERPELQLEDHNYVYDSVFSKAAAILEGIIRWHPFADGNKRTALATSVYYLKLEGYAIALPLSAVRFTVNIANNDKTDSISTQKLIEEITTWFRAHSDRNKLLLLGKLGLYIGIPYRFYQFLIKLGFLNYVYKKVAYWMAFDIYPEYAKEMSEIAKFIQETVDTSLTAVFGK